MRYGDTFPRSTTDSVNQLLYGANPATGKYDKHLVKENVLHPPVNNRPVNIAFEGSAVYSPITYLPHVIGYDIARLFSKSVVVDVYGGRLGDAIAWLLLIWLAIRLTPVGKWAFAAMGLLPQIVYSAATLQADAFNTSLCFLFVALILHLRFNEAIKSVSLKYLGILLAVMSAIALSKFAYIPIFLLVFLIPRRKMPRPFITWPSLLIIPTVLSFLWEYAVRNIAGKLDSILNGVKYGPKQQLHFVAHHPLSGIHAIINSMFSGASDHLVREMLGVFTWFYLLLPLWIQLISVATVVLALLYQFGRAPTLAVSRKALVLFSLAASTTLIFVTFYFLWSPAGAKEVLGVQGRYFLPMLSMLVLLFTGKKTVINLTQNALARLVQAGSLIGLCATVIVLANKFY